MSRILAILAAIIILGAAYLYFFGFETAMMWEAHKIGRRAPAVKLVPVALPDSSIASSEGRRLSYLGYDFEVPWNDLDETRTRLLANRVALVFHSGKTLMLSVGPPREFTNAVIGQLDRDQFRQIYGDGPLQSDYAMWQLIASTTPFKITLTTPRKEIVGAMMMLMVKAVAMPESSGFYSLETRDFKGFQWGNPDAHPRHIVADLFSDDAGMEFIFPEQKGHPLDVTQAEINRVLQSVHKTTASAKNSAVPTNLVAVRR
jgi:hypothetical protein